MSKKAVILLSGGLDSSTCLAIAKKEGFSCYAISFDYGQRHRVELSAAKRVADTLGTQEHRIVQLSLGDLADSALTDLRLAVPETPSEGIPITYVPARNPIFLSIALSWAESLGARDIFLGANIVDYSGYPDCRPEFIAAFEKMANLATKAGIEGEHFHIHTPLMHLNKADIVKEGAALGIDYALTFSCYQANAAGQACGVCDSCRIRADGFKQAGIADPTVYFS